MEDDVPFQLGDVEVPAFNFQGCIWPCLFVQVYAHSVEIGRPHCELGKE